MIVYIARLLLLSLCITITLYARVPLELWNKSKHTIFYGIFENIQEATQKPYEELAGGKWVTRVIPDKKTIFIGLSSGPAKKGKHIDIYKIVPSAFKALYLKTSECVSDSTFQAPILTPQDGPYLAQFADRALFAFNVKFEDLEHTQATYSGFAK